MHAFLTRFLGARRAAVVVEFALLLPLFILLVIGVVEFGRLLSQRTAVEKGLRAGATLAARSELPLSVTQRLRIENLIKTGDVDGNAPLLVPGWGAPGADVAVTTSSFSSGDIANLPVIRIEATVPYQPLIPGVMSTLGLDRMQMRLAHEQAYLDR